MLCTFTNDWSAPEDHAYRGVEWEIAIMKGKLFKHHIFLGFRFCMSQTNSKVKISIFEVDVYVDMITVQSPKKVPKQKRDDCTDGFTLQVSLRQYEQCSE